MKGTFYVNPGLSPNWDQNVPRWQAASRNGHEIGNHTTRHPCSCNWRRSSTHRQTQETEYCLEKMTLSDVETTIDEATAILDGLFPEQQGVRTYCYPCYEDYVGSGESRAFYVPSVARRFKAGRGRGDNPNNPYDIDLAYLWSWPVSGNTGAEMIDYVENVVDQGLWAVITAHGVGGDHSLDIEPRALEHLAHHLDQNRHRIWTDTVLHVAEYVIDRRVALAGGDL